MTVFNEYPNRPPRKSPRPRKPKVELDPAFRGWRDDSPQQLVERIDVCRRQAFKRILREAEWQELDKMRDVARANAKRERRSIRPSKKRTTSPAPTVT